jgi:hypothetical protein
MRHRPCQPCPPPVRILLKRLVAMEVEDEPDFYMSAKMAHYYTFITQKSALICQQKQGFLNSIIKN